MTSKINITVHEWDWTDPYRITTKSLTSRPSLSDHVQISVVINGFTYIEIRGLTISQRKQPISINGCTPFLMSLLDYPSISNVTKHMSLLDISRILRERPKIILEAANT